MRFRHTAALLLAGWMVLEAFSAPMAAQDQPLTKDAWGILEDGLRHKIPDRRADAVSALGLIRDDKKAAESAEEALQDPDRNVGRAAIAALGEMNATASLPRLKALVKSSDGKTVLAIAAVLRKFKDPEAFEIYYEILTGKRKDGGSIFDGLKDRKAIEKMAAETAIGLLPYGGVGTGAYDYLKKSESSHSNVDAIAATAIAEDQDPSAKVALVEAAIDAKEPVRVAALRALAERGDPSVVEDITPAMYSRRPVIRYTAAATVLHLLDLRSSKPSD